ncbi:MAG: hypothetical protein QNJ46_15105 [Leptolyngbyaceae cyanobacterium MO_188.B28]|nr:hypothetical protein [Leptolyngbyaceae cyanobacterium MO_188.B28]
MCIPLICWLLAGGENVLLQAIALREENNAAKSSPLVVKWGDLIHYFR